MRPTRTLLTGPLKGMSLMLMAALAPTVMRVSGWCSRSEERVVATIWISLRKPLGKRGRMERVGQAHGEDAIGGGTAFTAGEAAGNLADGVEALFVVDGEGEEVDTLAGVGHADRDKDNGIALAHGDGAVGEAGKGAVLDEQGLAANLDFVGTDAGFGCGHVSLHTFSCGVGRGFDRVRDG